MQPLCYTPNCGTDSLYSYSSCWRRKFNHMGRIICNFVSEISMTVIIQTGTSNNWVNTSSTVDLKEDVVRIEFYEKDIPFWISFSSCSMVTAVGLELLCYRTWSPSDLPWRSLLLSVRASDWKLFLRLSRLRYLGMHLISTFGNDYDGILGLGPTDLTSNTICVPLVTAEGGPSCSCNSLCSDNSKTIPTVMDNLLVSLWRVL